MVISDTVVSGVLAVIDVVLSGILDSVVVDLVDSGRLASVAVSVSVALTGTTSGFVFAHNTVTTTPAAIAIKAEIGIARKRLNVIAVLIFAAER